jgi:antitoxin (DNA-binding transcriptional repressor) of toxin-antitoxin stability system
MKEASVRDLRYDFKKIERLLRQGEEIRITKRRKVIARLSPERPEPPRKMPDFLAQMREIYGDRILPVTGAEIIAESRNREFPLVVKKESAWQKKAKGRSTRTAAS